MGFRIYGMSRERPEVAASGLSSVMRLSRYYRRKNRRKRRKFKVKGGRRDKKLQLQKAGRKTDREEKTQHN